MVIVLECFTFLSYYVKRAIVYGLQLKFVSWYMAFPWNLYYRLKVGELSFIQLVVGLDIFASVASVYPRVISLALLFNPLYFCELYYMLRSLIIHPISMQVHEVPETIEQRALAAAAPIESMRFLVEMDNSDDASERTAEEKLTDIKVGEKVSIPIGSICFNVLVLLTFCSLMW